MKILLLEYITAGGFYDVTLPSSLLREGQMMRDAVLRDFSQLDEITIITTHDARLLKPNNLPPDAIEIFTDPWPVWQELLQTCEAALVIAPETGNILHKLTAMVESSNAQNLGCDTSSIVITGSKFSTFKTLQAAAIPTVQTYRAESFFSEISSSTYSALNQSQAYVVKPDDGAGSENTRFFKTVAQLKDWFGEHKSELKNFITQPFQPGIPASISLLCHHDKAWVLASNRQKIEKDDNDSESYAFRYSGSDVNALKNFEPAFSRLAEKIIQAIPGLNGYVGVDVIIEGGDIVVVDINPRITTSYIGLANSLKYNPANLITSAALERGFEWPPLEANLVEVLVCA